MKVNKPTPDAQRIFNLVQFGFDALSYLEQVNAMFDDLMTIGTITEKGPDGELVAKLVEKGRICFPPENNKEKRQ